MINSFNFDSLPWQRGSLNESSFKALCKLAARSIDESVMREVLEQVSARINDAGDRAQQRKLADQTRDAFAFVARQRAIEILCGRDDASAAAQAKWPEPEHALINELGAASTLAQLISSSASSASEAHEVLPLLFPHAALVCSAREKEFARVDPVEELCAFAVAAQYVVPNVAVGRECFVERLGKRSARFKENFPERRFIVVEFDHVKHPPYDELELQHKLDMQAALHMHLREFATLVLVVFSGNASLHGWYSCSGASEHEAREFLQYACRLGADHALFSTCQLTRMPGGTHSNNARQEVVFFAPEEIE